MSLIGSPQKVVLYSCFGTTFLRTANQFMKIVLTLFRSVCKALDKTRIYSYCCGIQFLSRALHRVCNMNSEFTRTGITNVPEKRKHFTCQANARPATSPIGDLSEKIGRCELLIK